MFEILKRLPIHPVQYGLVGLALAVFFLLLGSLLLFGVLAALMVATRRIDWYQLGNVDGDPAGIQA